MSVAQWIFLYGIHYVLGNARRATRSSELRKDQSYKKRRPSRDAACGSSSRESFLHHAAHAATCGHSGHVLLGLGHDNIRGHDEAADGGRVLQRGARDIVGSVTPAETRSSYWPARALKPMLPPSVRTLSTTMEPSAPALRAIWRIGSSSARWMILAPVRSSPSRESSRSATGCWACRNATPPPGTMPSSRAAR